MILALLCTVACSDDATNTDTGTDSTSSTGDGDGDGDGDGCVQLTDNIELSCTDDADCGEGYTCHTFNGFVVVTSCQILCKQDCECPDGRTCTPAADNINQWMQCM